MLGIDVSQATVRVVRRGDPDQGAARDPDASETAELSWHFRPDGRRKGVVHELMIIPPGASAELHPAENYRIASSDGRRNVGELHFSHEIVKFLQLFSSTQIII